MTGDLRMMYTTDMAVKFWPLTPGSYINEPWSLKMGGVTHYHTISNFDTTYKAVENNEKRRNCLLQVISPFLTMFSTLYGTYCSV